jgi:dipeptidase E
LEYLTTGKFILSQLFLYSDQKSGCSDLMDEELLKLLHQCKYPKIGYISSETDKRRRFFEATWEHYRKMGIPEITYSDLENEFDLQILKNILQYPVVHLSGGDISKFLFLCQKTNALPLLKKYVVEGGILVGISAGAMLMMPDISHCHTLEKSTISLKSKKALNLVDFEFFPHFDEFPGAEKILLQRSTQINIPIYACSDYDGIIINKEGDCRFIGNPVMFFKGQKKIIGNPLV